jgi:hypothetical protein
LAPSSVGALAEKQNRMELAVQQNQSDIRNHVEGCVEGQKRIDKRFDGIDQRFDGMDDRFDKIDASIKVVSEAQVASASAAVAVAEAATKSGRPKWWHPVALALGVLFFSVVIGLLGWMGSTIWSLEQEKITALQNRPQATVTVNPVAGAQAVPAPVAPVTEGVNQPAQ